MAEQPSVPTPRPPGATTAVDRTYGRLTPREREVLAAVAGRLTNQEIADDFGLSKRTVEDYISSLYRKLGVSTRRELVALAKPETPKPRTRQPHESPPAKAIPGGDPLTSRWVELSIRHAARQSKRNREHIARSTTQIQRNHHHATGSAPPVPPARAPIRGYDEAFARAVDTERAAIRRHEAAALRLDELAAALEHDARRAQDETLQGRAFAVAEKARERARASRARAEGVRRRLRAEGVAP